MSRSPALIIGIRHVRPACRRPDADDHRGPEADRGAVHRADRCAQMRCVAGGRPGRGRAWRHARGLHHCRSPVDGRAAVGAARSGVRAACPRRPRPAGRRRRRGRAAGSAGERPAARRRVQPPDRRHRAGCPGAPATPPARGADAAEGAAPARRVGRARPPARATGRRHPPRSACDLGGADVPRPGRGPAPARARRRGRRPGPLPPPGRRAARRAPGPPAPGCAASSGHGRVRRCSTPAPSPARRA